MLGHLIKQNLAKACFTYCYSSKLIGLTKGTAKQNISSTFTASKHAPPHQLPFSPAVNACLYDTPWPQPKKMSYRSQYRRCSMWNRLLHPSNVKIATGEKKTKVKELQQGELTKLKYVTKRNKMIWHTTLACPALGLCLAQGIANWRKRKLKTPHTAERLCSTLQVCVQHCIQDITINAVTG